MQNRILASVLCLCVGLAIFSLQDPLLKSISSTYPVTEALSLRAIVAMPILLFLMRGEGGISALASPQLGLLLLRSVILFVSYLAYYLGIVAMTLADAVSLFSVGPLVITALAVPLLGEVLRWQTIAALVIGLAGVIVTIGPGSGLLDWTALLPLTAAATYAIAQVMARRMGETSTAAVMTFYQNACYLAGSLVIAGVLVALPVRGFEHPSIAFLVRPWVWPTLVDLGKMSACGVIAAAGMMLLAQAYRLAPASRITAFEYTAILWSPLWGFLFFAEVPRETTFAGAALIVLAGLLALSASRNARRAEIA